ncbi:hypothetical protein Agub_g6573 [Astrephomene gubernaculifera]|uniref:Histone deacetylase domain-containing protein n=1 Tax=Astrephomene gubernaculifera TaxID=47775 RepID=A0AAD3HLX2_9CHLO|nr:hypothetical protein Agub_g6573 [Astrephomene gubernaculifera]
MESTGVKLAASDASGNSAAPSTSPAAAAGTAAAPGPASAPAAAPSSAAAARPQQQPPQPAPQSFTTPRTRIYYNPELSEFSLGDDHPMVPHRLHLTHRLAELWGLFDDPAVQLVQDYAPATPDQLRRFHTDEYIAFLEYLDTLDLASMSVEEQQELLGDDLALFGLSVCRPAVPQEEEDEEAAAAAGPGPGSAVAVKSEQQRASASRQQQDQRQQQQQRQRAKSESQQQPMRQPKAEAKPGGQVGPWNGGSGQQIEPVVPPQLLALATQLVVKLVPLSNQQLTPAQQQQLLVYLKQQLQQQNAPIATSQPPRGGFGSGGSRPLTMVRPGQTQPYGKGGQQSGGSGSKKRKADGGGGGGKGKGGSKKNAKGRRRRSSYSEDDDDDDEMSEEDEDASPAAQQPQPAACAGATGSSRPSRQAATAVAALTNAVRKTEAEESEEEESEEDEDEDDDDEGGDCPIFPGLLRYVGLQAAGSILAARDLASGACDVAVHWGGGMHHGMPYRAFGFCYVNDLVLAILELMAGCGRVLYIDVDVHHGDGVETAFKRSEKVLSISLHKWDDGRLQASIDTLNHGKPQRPVFFPGTGKKNDLGEGSGKYYTVNVPLQDDIADESYFNVYKAVVKTAFERFKPQAVVLQCGCDSVAGDKLGRFNLSIRGHSRCVELVRDLCRTGGCEGGGAGRGGANWRIPLLVTGGGGYTPPLVARCWALETAVLLGRTLGEAMPPAVAAAADLADLGPSYFKDVDLSRPPTAPYSMCLDTILLPGAHKQMDSDYSLSRLAGYLTSNMQRITIRDAPSGTAAAATAAGSGDKAAEEGAAAAGGGGTDAHAAAPAGPDGKEGGKDAATAAPAAKPASRSRKSASASGPGVADPLRHLTAVSNYPDAEEYIQDQKDRVAANAPWAAKMPPPPVPKGRKAQAAAAAAAAAAQGGNNNNSRAGGANGGKQGGSAAGGNRPGASGAAAAGQGGKGTAAGGTEKQSAAAANGASVTVPSPHVPGLPTIMPYKPKSGAAAAQPATAAK